MQELSIQFPGRWCFIWYSQEPSSSLHCFLEQHITLFAGYPTEDQINGLSVELLSIENGHAENLLVSGSIEGSMCIVRLLLPEKVRFLAMGVDPDPDADGNLSNSLWLPENNTIPVRYDSGHRNPFIISGENIMFRQGRLHAKASGVIGTYSVHDNME
ncbi:hypothetical protein PV02_03065 [Methanolobus chelungpuianus]|uniref:Uncharacterized protein n=2 Tax=Methanolobus chelungpuianus TaxID=502115 RepID=A0AAE3KWF4_9EURY|nr:hypothetical protein [Methanolobus chelungpuianus]